MIRCNNCGETLTGLISLHNCDKITAPSTTHYCDECNEPIYSCDWDEDDICEECKKERNKGEIPWCSLSEETEYRIIKQETIGNYWISTVWLSLNHNFDIKKPFIFETMVFKKIGEDVDWTDLDCERYSTLEDAIKGHQEKAKKWKANDTNESGNLGRKN